MNRRTFLFAGAAPLLAQSTSLTAQQVIDRIQKQLGMQWEAGTVDTFKAGNPDTRVRGIVTTVMSTLDVLQKSAAAGKNLIITHEPTFYNHLDETKEFANDPVYQAKQALIQKNDMVIWRFHDHWHRKRPEPMAAAFLAAMGWEKYANGRAIELPSQPLRDVVQSLRTKLKLRGIRVVGDPALPVHRIAFNPGFLSLQGATRNLSRPDVDVLIAGETREWEGVEYAQDAVAAGQKKALVLLGHLVSEELGMEECAKWLKEFVTEVPIEHISAGEPFWTPADS